MFSAGDVVTVDFPGVTGVKRRPAVILSSDTYHASRPDIIIGLITSQAVAATGPTDYALLDWSSAGLRVASVFRCFIATLPQSARVTVIGHLTERDWEQVRACVKAALTSLEDPPSPPAP